MKEEEIYRIMCIYVRILLTPVMSSRCNYINIYIYSIDSCDVIKIQLFDPQTDEGNSMISLAMTYHHKYQ